MAAGIQQQDAAEDIVIAGAGLAGLAVALGLHRKGVRSVVLESSPERRTSGFAFFTWTNAFRALDALGVGDKMRGRHLQLQGYGAGHVFVYRGPHEVRCVQRNVLLQALEEELPPGTIRYSSKIVSIDDQDGDGDGAKILHLADGSTLRAKVLIGCDGINSVVAKWLGLARPSESGRTATRGHARYPEGHAFEPKILQFVGEGFRAGLVPWSDTDVYWFLTWSPAPSPDANGKDDGVVHWSAAAMKQFVLTKMRGAKVSPEVLEAVERSEMNEVLAAPLRYRSPLSLLFASFSKGNVCVAGDALYPTTPDLAQGACTALEDGVVLARCLGDAIVGAEGEGRGGPAQVRRYPTVEERAGNRGVVHCGVRAGERSRRGELCAGQAVVRGARQDAAHDAGLRLRQALKCMYCLFLAACVYCYFLLRDNTSHSYRKRHSTSNVDTDITKLKSQQNISLHIKKR